MKRYIEYQREYEEYVRSCTEQGHQPSVQQYFFIAQRLLNDYGVQDALKEGGPKELQDDIMKLPRPEMERFLKDLGEYLRHLER